MGLITLIILLVVLVAIFIAGLVTVNGFRTRGQIERALNMSLYLVRVTQETGQTDSSGNSNERKTTKELIGVAEQLITSFYNIHSKGWNKFIYGEPYLTLEVAVHHVGEQTHFYIAVPKANEDGIVKQLYAYYPNADIAKVKDYNIFNAEGAVAGSFLKYTADPILPLRTYQKLETDPMGGVLTAMSKLQNEGEGAAMQLMIRPSHNDKNKKLAAKVAREMQSGYQFKEAIQRAKHPVKPKKPDPNKPPEPEKPRVVTPTDDEIIKAITNKSGKQSYDINIRLITSAPSPERADQILKEFESSFVALSSPDLNSLKPNKLTGSALQKLIYNFSFRLFDKRQTIAMSTEEIASFYHFPIVGTSAPKVNFLKSKQAEPPANLPTEGVTIGKNSYRGQDVEIRMTDADRRRHLYIIGQTGTGKSSLMKEMIRQDIQAGKGVCIVDPHGEFAEHVLSIIPPARAEDVIYFNPGDTERPMGLNLFEFDPTKPEQKTLLANEFFTIMKTIYKDLPEAFGPMFEQYYKNSALLLMDVFERKFAENGNSVVGIENEIPTMVEIPRIFTDEAFRREKLKLEPNPLVKNFWEQEAEKAGGEAALANMAPYINSKMSPFLTNDFLRPIIGQHQSAFNFRTMMDEQKILIVNLSKGRIGEINGNLLGMMIVSKLTISALSRVDIVDENLRKDFYLYIDEFQNFTTPSIATILSEARKYKLDLTVAHQYIKQLQDNIRDAIFGNVGSMAVFRIGAEDAEFLKNQFSPTFSVQDIMNIDNFNYYAKLLINNQPAKPFNVKTVKEAAGSPEITRAINEISRLKFGRPREEVEAEIKSRYKQ